MIGIAITCNVFRQHEIQRVMQRRTDNPLSVIVIDSYGIESLKIRKVFEH